MKKAYWVAMVEITDPDAYPAYVASNGAAIAPFGAKLVVRGGRYAHPEGSTGNRHVLVEFDDYETALACYHAPPYQEVVRLRHAASTGSFVIVEGAPRENQPAEAGAGKKGYWLAMVDVTDPENYPRYIAANKAAFDKYGAKFLVRGGRFSNPEAVTGNRHVVVEFDSFDTALACYHSPEYQDALPHRLAASTGRFVIVEGT